MSGIAGVITRDGAPPDAALLQRMAQGLAFRGPDACSVWERPGTGFCFTFLRTGPAPQANEQPLTLDGHVWLLADARLDDRETLRERLAEKDCPLSAEATDEELILHAWRLWGTDSLEILRGDFAFVLWDSRDGSVWCARDPMGGKLLYYAHSGVRLIFSNSLDVIRLSPDVGAALDPRSVADFLLDGWCSDPARTIFRDIRRLPAGHLLHIVDDRSELRRTARLPIEDPLQLKRGEEYVEAFQEVFGAAVRDRLPHDSVALFLSGGLDSTSVAAMAKLLAERDGANHSFHAFTVDYRPLFDDEEGRYGSLAAAHFGFPSEVLSGSGCRPYDRWESPEVQPPDLCHEPFRALQIDQYRQVAVHSRVVLSGDGGDDILNGQAWPHLVFLAKRGSFATLFRLFGGYILSHGRVPPLRGGFRSRLRQWFGGRTPSDGDYPGWLNSEFEKEHHLRDRWMELRRISPDEHPFHPRAYRVLTSPYWPSVLEQEEAGWTRAPVELRAPFLDWRVLRFLLRIPPVPWCMEKELLRRAMRHLLPAEIRKRPKTPMLEDPLVVHARQGNWSPLPLPAPAGEIEGFVDWSRLHKELAGGSPDRLWLNLRPLSFNYWLKTAPGIGTVKGKDTG